MITSRTTRSSVLTLDPLKLFLLGLLTMLMDPQPTRAAIMLSSTDSGFVTVAGGSAKGDGTISSATFNYSVGHELHFDDGSLTGGLAPMDRKNYFVFDLTSVVDPIISASLLVPAGVYESSDPTETFVVGETTAPGAALADIDALLAGNMTMDPTLFDDPSDPLVGVAAALYTKLADGVPLASAVVSSADDGTTLSIPFTADGIAYLNSFLGARLVLGGTLPTAPGPATPEAIFGFTDFTTPMIELETAMAPDVVPEPAGAAIWLLGSAASFLIGCRRLRRRGA